MKWPWQKAATPTQRMLEPDPDPTVEVLPLKEIRMSTPTPVPGLSANTPFVIKFLTDLLVGAQINAGTGGDATKQYAHAQVIIGVANGLLQVNAGDPQGGLATIEAAIGSLQSSDPAKSAALEGLLYWIGGKVVALQQVTAGTVTGALVANITDQIANEAIMIAAKYPAPAAPAA